MRLGIYGGFGSHESSDGTYDDSGFATSFESLFGGTPGSGWVIGGGIFHVGIDHDEPINTVFGFDSRFGAGPFIMWYPDPTGGLNLQVMPGFIDTPGDSGVFISAGAGYDAWVGDEWSVGGFLRYLHARSDSDEAYIGDYRAHYGLLGFVATLH